MKYLKLRIKMKLFEDKPLLHMSILVTGSGSRLKKLANNSDPAQKDKYCRLDPRHVQNQMRQH
jgi:hypothetical protein